MAPLGGLGVPLTAPRAGAPPCIRGVCGAPSAGWSQASEGTERVRVAQVAGIHLGLLGLGHSTDLPAQTRGGVKGFSREAVGFRWRCSSGPGAWRGRCREQRARPSPGGRHSRQPDPTSYTCGCVLSPSHACTRKTRFPVGIGAVKRGSGINESWTREGFPKGRDEMTAEAAVPGWVR